MSTAIERFDPEHDMVQQLVKEAVVAGMKSPSREPMLEAVGETTEIAKQDRENLDERDATEKSRFVMAAQGTVVFAVMFVVLYATLRRLTDDEGG